MPETARFMAEDAFKGDGLNRYVYVRNNPLVLIDPTGFACSEASSQVTIGNVIVRYGLVRNGVTTGYSRDVVRGLGGFSIEMGNGQVFITLPNYETGESLELILDTNSGQITNNQGNRIAGATTHGGLTRVGIRQFAQLAGVEDTISHWTETQGGKSINYVTVKPDMKYAPVQVTRTGDNININAYINFTGEADKFMPNGFTYAEIAAKGIIKEWSGSWIGSSYDFEPDKTITTNVTIHSNNRSPNGLWSENIDRKQDYFDIKIGGDGRSYQNDITIPSFVSDVFVEGDWYLSNWSTKYVGYIRLYTTENKVQLSPSEISWTAAHEFGHILGLGDAYGEGKRPEADSNSEILPDDIMRVRGGVVSANDIEMAWHAWQTNQYQSFQNWNSRPGRWKPGAYNYYKSGAIRLN